MKASAIQGYMDHLHSLTVKIIGDGGVEMTRKITVKGDIVCQMSSLLWLIIVSKWRRGSQRKKLNEFCEGRDDFLRLPNILQKFVQQDQTYGANQAMDCLILFKSMLDACKDVNPVSTFQTMMLAWDTGA